jgi:UDP-N-acetylglucosamine 4,6-dehydratase
MIPIDDARRTVEFDRYYIMQPNFAFWEKRNNHGGKPVDENFEYNSGTNPWILAVEDMKVILKTL